MTRSARRMTPTSRQRMRERAAATRVPTRTRPSRSVGARRRPMGGTMRPRPRRISQGRRSATGSRSRLASMACRSASSGRGCDLMIGCVVLCTYVWHVGICMYNPRCFSNKTNTHAPTKKEATRLSKTGQSLHISETLVSMPVTGFSPLAIVHRYVRWSFRSCASVQSVLSIFVSPPLGPLSTAPVT